MYSFFIFLTIQFNIQSDIRANVIPPFYSFYGMAILGSLIIFCISYLINNLSVVGGQISYLGKNSLIIMCIHEPIKRVLLVVLSKVSSLPIEELRGNILLSIICVCILLLICVPIVNVINKNSLDDWQILIISYKSILNETEKYDVSVLRENIISLHRQDCLYL